MSAYVAAELASRRRWLAGLSLGTFTLLFLIAVSYQSIGLGLFAHAFPGSQPRALQAFTGSHSGNMFTPRGWLSFGFNHPMYLVLTLAVAITIGTSAVAGEVENGRAELVYTRPLRRRRLLWAGLGIWAIGELTVVAAAYAGALVGGAISPEVSTSGLGPVIFAPLQYLPLAFLVAAISFLASALARTRGRAMAVAIGLTVVAYLVNFAAGLFDWLDWAHQINPFGHYDPFGAIDQGFQWGDAGLLIGAGLLVMGAATAAIERRDLA